MQDFAIRAPMLSGHSLFAKLTARSRLSIRLKIVSECQVIILRMKATAFVGILIANEQQDKVLTRRPTTALKKCLRVFVSRALSHVSCIVSLLDQPLQTNMFIEGVPE